MKPTGNLECEPRSLVARWLDSCPDAWLAAEVRKRLDMEGAYEEAVAAAVFARFRIDSWTREQAREFLSRYLSGEDLGEASGPAEWIRDMDRDEVARIEDRAVAEAGRLAQSLKTLLAEADLDDPHWRSRLVEACHRRDDLDALLDLLASRLEIPRGLREALAEADIVGEAVAGILPPSFHLEDERLNRVTVTAPDAWWVRPVW